MIGPSPATLRLADDYFIMADNLDNLANGQGKLNEMLRFVYPTLQKELQVMVGSLRHEANQYRREARQLAFGREDASGSRAYPSTRLKDPVIQSLDTLEPVR